ncbi:hypothetical protein BDF21DRAFT_433586 [Thamnidium elegans]|nr:hypothetical protein BDF21DRAFT_433586 [Thamnidium elegans]
MIFKRNFDEYGLTECSRYHQFNDTEQLLDGGFKMSKVLKDMFVNLSNSSPDKVRDIVTVGYQLMETKFTLSIMDSPAGSVCRINHLYPLQFPDDPQLITKQLLQISEVVYRSRLIIETTRLITSDIVAAFDLGEGGPFPPCFYIQPKSTTSKEKKRKTSL